MTLDMRGLFILTDSASAMQVLFGPMVQLYPPGHPIDPDLRNGIHGPEYARAITIGDDVWVGGSVIIMGRPTLGNVFAVLHATNGCS